MLLSSAALEPEIRLWKWLILMGNTFCTELLYSSLRNSLQKDCVVLFSDVNFCRTIYQLLAISKQPTMICVDLWFQNMERIPLDLQSMSCNRNGQKCPIPLCLQWGKKPTQEMRQRSWCGGTGPCCVTLPQRSFKPFCFLPVWTSWGYFWNKQS